MPFKRCSNCGIEKPLGNFSKHAIQKDGHNSECRACANARTQAYRLANKEKVTAKNKAYYLANRERITARAQLYYHSHQEETIARSKAWYGAHKEQAKAKNKAYRALHLEEEAKRRRAYVAKHHDKALAGSRRYQLRHPDRVKHANASYHMAHPDKMRDRCSRRRAKIRNAYVEVVSRTKVYDRDKGRCHFCGHKVDKKKWHLDHLVPLSLGGEHSYRNVAVSCPQCNLHRSNSGPAQLRLIG